MILVVDTINVGSRKCGKYNVGRNVECSNVKCREKMSGVKPMNKVTKHFLTWFYWRDNNEVVIKTVRYCFWKIKVVSVGWLNELEVFWSELGLPMGPFRCGKLEGASTLCNKVYASYAALSPPCVINVSNFSLNIFHELS